MWTRYPGANRQLEELLAQEKHDREARESRVNYRYYDPEIDPNPVDQRRMLDEAADRKRRIDEADREYRSRFGVDSVW